MGTAIVKTSEELFGKSTKTKTSEELFGKSSIPETTSGFFPGMYRGFIDLAEGLKQRDIEARQFLNMSPDELLRANQQEQELLSIRSARPELSSDFMTKAGEFVGGVAPTLPLPGASTSRLPIRMLVQGLMGGLQGYAQPTKKGESVTKNVALGAGGGAGITGAMAPIGKALNAVKGVFPKIYDEAIKASKKYGIDLSLGEIKSNPLIQKAETWLEAIPLLGIKKFREKQQAEVSQAGANFLADYVTNPKLSTTEAMKVANDVYLTTLYEGVKASGKQLPAIHAGQTKQTAMELAKDFPAIFESLQDAKLKRIINDIIKSTGKGEWEGLVPPKQLSFDNLWMLRKGIGQEIGDASTDTAKGILKKMYSAVSDDMDAMFSQMGGDEGNKFKFANEEFKRLSLKFDAVRKAYDVATGTIKGGETGLFSPKKFATELKNLANDPNYKKNIKWSPEEIEHMTGLATILETAKRAGQYMENPPTGNRWGIPQMIGIGLGIPGGVAMGGSPGYAAGMIGTELSISAIGKFLTTSEIGKRFAIATSKLEPNSPAMLKMVYEYLPRLMIQSGFTQQEKK